MRQWAESFGPSVEEVRNGAPTDVAIQLCYAVLFALVGWWGTEQLDGVLPRFPVVLVGLLWQARMLYLGGEILAHGTSELHVRERGWVWRDGFGRVTAIGDDAVTAVHVAAVQGGGANLHRNVALTSPAGRIPLYRLTNVHAIDSVYRLAWRRVVPRLVAEARAAVAGDGWEVGELRVTAGGVTGGHGFAAWADLKRPWVAGQFVRLDWRAGRRPPIQVLSSKYPNGFLLLDVALALWREAGGEPAPEGPGDPEFGRPLATWDEAGEATWYLRHGPSVWAASSLVTMLILGPLSVGLLVPLEAFLLWQLAAAVRERIRPEAELYEGGIVRGRVRLAWADLDTLTLGDRYRLRDWLSPLPGRRLRLAGDGGRIALRGRGGSFEGLLELVRDRAGGPLGERLSGRVGPLDLTARESLGLVPEWGPGGLALSDARGRPVFVIPQSTPNVAGLPTALARLAEPETPA